MRQVEAETDDSKVNWNKKSEGNFLQRFQRLAAISFSHGEPCEESGEDGADVERGRECYIEEQHHA